MGNNTTRSLFGYLLIACIGTGLTVAGAAWFKVRRVQQSVEVCRNLLQDNRPQDAFAMLSRYAAWSTPYPVLAHSIACEMIRCHVRLSRKAMARDQAQAIRERKWAQPPRPENLPDILEYRMAPVINRLFLSRQNPPPGLRTGYAIFAEELLRCGDIQLHEQVVKVLAEIDALNSIRDSLMDEDTPPASKGSTPGTTPEDSAPRWGIVVKSDANAYNASGKFLRKITPGTFLSVTGDARSQAGELAICTVQYHGRDIPGVLIKKQDLDIFDGDFSKVDENEKKMRVRKIEILKEMEQLEKKLGEQNPNPYHAEYQRTKQSHAAYWKKVKDLTAHVETQEGSERIEAYNELRRMKGEDMRLAEQMEHAERKYNEWEAAHPEAAEKEDPPELSALKLELARIDAQLDALKK